MRQFLLPAVAFVFTAFFNNGFLHAQQGPGTKYAVVVGIDEYEDGKRLPRLNYAEADAKVLADTLRKAGCKVKPLLGKDATKKNIEAAVADILAEAKGVDSLLFAFAGHGQQFQPAGEAKDAPFLCTPDCNATQADTQVRLNTLLTKAGDSKVGRALFLIDACRTDPGQRGGVTGNAVSNLNAQTEVLFSAANGQRAREHADAGGKGNGHGLFMSEVIAAFEGEAKNRRGEVTWSGLVKHINDEVTAKSKSLFPNLQDNQHQTPHRIGSMVGDVVLSVVAAPPSERKPTEEKPMLVAPAPMPGKIMSGTQPSGPDSATTKGDPKQPPETTPESKQTGQFSKISPWEVDKSKGPSVAPPSVDPPMLKTSDPSELRLRLEELMAFQESEALKSGDSIKVRRNTTAYLNDEKMSFDIEKGDVKKGTQGKITEIVTKKNEPGLTLNYALVKLDDGRTLWFFRSDLAPLVDKK